MFCYKSCICNVVLLFAMCAVSETAAHLQSGMQADSLDTSGVKLAIVMELCRFGTFYHLIEQARRVAHLPADVRSGSKAPRSAEEAKLKVRMVSIGHFLRDLLVQLYAQTRSCASHSLSHAQPLLCSHQTQPVY